MPIIQTVIKGGGIQPTGTKNITSNGVYDVTDYASADVQVPTTAPAHYVEKTKDANNKLVNGLTFINLSGVTDLGDYVLKNAYYRSAISGALDFSSLTSISGSDALAEAFRYSSGITSVDMSNVISITGSSALSASFRNCSGITSVDLSSLTTVAASNVMNSAFQDDNNIISIDLSSLTTVSGNQAMYYAFYGTLRTDSPFVLPSLTTVSGSSTMSNCFEGTGVSYISFPVLKTISSGDRQMSSCCSNNSKLTGANMPSLEEVSSQYGMSNCFWQCPNFVTMGFPSLSILTGSGVMSGCFSRSGIQSVWFYALNPSSFGSYTNQFNGMFGNQVSNATVHFPMSIQSTIGSWTDVTNGFGGTNTTVLFDIVTSLTGADGNTYTRKEKESTSTATAWVYNDTLYYTSGVSNHTAGVNEPVVSDTIYSDAACTTAVTTIDSIA